MSLCLKAFLFIGFALRVTWIYPVQRWPTRMVDGPLPAWIAYLCGAWMLAYETAPAAFIRCCAAFNQHRLAVHVDNSNFFFMISIHSNDWNLLLASRTIQLVFVFRSKGDRHAFVHCSVAFFWLRQCVFGKIRCVYMRFWRIMFKALLKCLYHIVPEPLLPKRAYWNLG